MFDPTHPDRLLVVFTCSSFLIARLVRILIPLVFYPTPLYDHTFVHIPPYTLNTQHLRLLLVLLWTIIGLRIPVCMLYPCSSLSGSPVLFAQVFWWGSMHTFPSGFICYSIANIIGLS